MTHSAPAPTLPQPMNRAGRLVLVPNALDLGCHAPDSAPDLRDVLPQKVIVTAAGLRHWVAENAKSARAFLKRVDRIAPLGVPMQEINIIELPREPKGGTRQQAAPSPARSAAGSPAPAPSLMTALLAPALAGHDLGLLSEAGLPGVADPGAALVQEAHRSGIAVCALSGPSSLTLALAASGLNGQSFCFVGYLPQDATTRGQRLQELEQQSRRKHQTQLMIETPYRNAVFLAALLEHLHPDTLLSVSCGLTLDRGYTRTDRVGQWRKQPGMLDLPADTPAVFAFLAR